MNTVAIILARGGSKGIPNKNIIFFCGEPLISHTIKQCKQTENISQVYVSTDDHHISTIAKELNCTVIDRPQHLSTDISKEDDGLFHALGCVDSCDTVITPHVTSPLREPNDFQEALHWFKKNKYDSLFSASLLEDPCVWSSNLKSITYDYKNRVRRQDKKPYYLENGSFYIINPSVFTKFKNRICGKYGVYLMPFWKSHEIDSYEGLDLCAYYMNTKILKKKIQYV